MAALRISSETVTAEELSARLHLTPTRTLRMGDPVTLRTPNAPRRTHHTFILDSGLPTSEPMEMLLAALVDMIEPRAEALRQLQSEAEMDLFCGFSSVSGQGSCELSPELMGRLSRLNLFVVLDLYAPGEPADGPA